MKLEVGMYLRTDKGYIGKLDIKKETIAVANWTGDYELEEITQYYVNNNRYNKFEIIKTSHNIIDLIEVGDIVVSLNGANILEYNLMTLSNIDELKDLWNIQKNIKSIVTKEQFENMSYKVGDE